MGCCAAKPRVLKGEEAEQPVRLPSSRCNKEIVHEATEAQNNVQADFYNHNVDVKGKAAVHQTDKRRSLSNLFKEEEMQMFDKLDNVDVKGKAVVHQTDHKRRSLSNLFKEEEMQMLAKTNKTKPEMHASTESEMIRKKMQMQSSKANHEIAEPTKHNKRPELAPRQNGVNVITNQEIELIDEPDHVLVAPEPRQSSEAKSAPKVIVEEHAKPTEQIHESDPVRDVAPKTGKLEKAK